MHSLVDEDFIEELAEVMTYGFKKYTKLDEQGNVIITGKNNWKKGLPWSEVLDSAYRHIHGFRKKIFKDSESELHHLAHAAANIMFLHYYSKHRREFDDIPDQPLYSKRIGLDVDEVLANFIPAWKTETNITIDIHHWSFDHEIELKFQRMKDEGRLEPFYLSLEPLLLPSQLPFEPVCYITNRPVDTKVTKEWLYRLGFPQVDVITTTDKPTACKKMHLDAFVDDNFYNYQNISKSGTLCYLYDQPHNRKFEVGYKRIKSLNEIY